jgi:hypothetical protein
MIRKFRMVLLVPVVLGLALGCGKSGTTPASVHGKITYNGEILKGGQIALHDKNGGGLYSAPIGLDGTYHIADLPIGTMGVTIETETVKAKQNPTYGAGRGGGKGAVVSKAPEDVPEVKG